MGASLSWSLAETSGGILLTLIIYVFLGSLLDAREFGQVAVAMIAANVVIPLATLGMGEALIQSRRFSSEQFSSVLWLAMGLAVVWGGLLWVLAPLLESWLREPGLTRIMRCLAVLPLFEVIFRMMAVVLKRELNLRPLAIRRFLGLLFSGATSVWLAFQGAGAAALAVFHLMNAAFSASFLLWRNQVALRLTFSGLEVRRLFPYAWHATGLLLFDVLRKRLVGVLVVWAFGVGVLGIYAFADRMTSIFQEAVVRAVHQFAFPLFSKLQGENSRLRSIFTRSVEWVMALSLLAYGGMAWLATDLLRYLFAERWLGSAWLVPLLVAGFLAESLLSLLDALGRAVGRPQIILNNRLILGALFILIFYICHEFGIYAVFLCCSLAALLIVPLLYRRLLLHLGWDLKLSHFRIHVSLAALAAMLACAVGLTAGDSATLPRIILSIGGMTLVYGAVWMTLHPAPREVLFFWRHR
jgi:O-antigen/teichoic acid export membrane protein